MCRTSVVLKYLDHAFVATNKPAASVQYACVRETAFLHDLSRCRITGEMVSPDVIEMLHVDAVVKHLLQGFGTDSFIPIRLSYPVAHLTVVFSDRNIAGCMSIVSHATDGFASLFQDNRPCRVIMEESPDNLPTFFHRLMCLPSSKRPNVRV